MSAVPLQRQRASPSKLPRLSKPASCSQGAIQRLPPPCFVTWRETARLRRITSSVIFCCAPPRRVSQLTAAFRCFTLPIPISRPMRCVVHRRVKGVKQIGFRGGNWLNRNQARFLLEIADGGSLRSIQDGAMISILLGRGLRRAKFASL